MKTPSAQIIPWHFQALTRMKSQFFLKSIGISLFMWGFFAGYFYLLKHPVYPVTTMPLTVLDSAIGFQPATLFLYISLWLYVTLPPALQATRRDLIYYGLAVAALCIAGLTFFLFWPTAVPATNIDWDRYYGFSILKGVDAAGNACPSLHVATAVFSAVWLNHLLIEMGAPPLVRAFNWMWCAGIVYSTLATKQHVALDMAAGAVLGALTAVLSLTFLSRIARKSLIDFEFEQSQEL